MLNKLKILMVCVMIADAIIFGSALAVMRGNGLEENAMKEEECSMKAPETTTTLEDTKTTGNTDTAIALTFDDGPHAECTPLLLDGLNARGVHATFFLMGQNIPGNEVLVQRMQQEGHLIGNHSYRHIQLTKASESAVCQAVEETGELIASITGSRPQYLRPPYGAWNESLECHTNLTTVFWTVDSLDWKLQDTAAIVRRVEQTIKPGDIILLHDIFPTSVAAALRLIDDLQTQGYTFVTVDELLVE